MPFRKDCEGPIHDFVPRLGSELLGEIHARYARSVVVAEEDSADRPPRRTVFFGVRNRADRATQLSADHLVKPLAAVLGNGTDGSWKVETYLAEEATKAKLKSLLATAAPPAILFTASHGMGFPNGNERQAAHQGALLCQDWPGPLAHRAPIPPEFYFSADDVTDDTRYGSQEARHQVVDRHGCLYERLRGVDAS